jgi:hypothetical protein
MIDEERLANALRYRAMTDDQCASLKAEMLRTERKAKAIRAAMFMAAEGTVAVRDATADTRKEVEDAWEEHFKAVNAYTAIANKRDSEEIIIDVWRSLNASLRKGNV